MSHHQKILNSPFTVELSEELLDTLDQIMSDCIELCLSMSSAESVTSGAIQYLLSQGDQCTLCYQGGLTAYNDEQKYHILNIPEELTSYNYAVSTDVADALARASIRLFHSDLGIGITGFAIQDDLCEYAHAYLSICHVNDIVIRQQLIPPSEDKRVNQMYYAMQTIHLLDAYLKNLKNKKP